MTDPATDAPIHEPCDGCDELMDVTSFGPFDAVVCPLCSAETRVKRQFGTYRLEQRFAIGGMSVIFVGWDKTLNRKVAIKVLNEEYCNDEVRIEAFENEARLTAQVSHPNVVKVFAVGRAYGRFYLVMELLEGKSFEHIMKKRGALPEDEVLEIASQVATGLQAAKKAGMIHRDVKPGNIHIDGNGRTRLLDFGLALITQDGRAQADEVWATPYYVPPEALERGIEDSRSDIYAFGATLYHALAGRPPFESTTNSNSLLRKAKQTIPRLCKVAPWVSPNTGEAIDRMMAFKPENRWSNYSKVMAALEHAKKTIGQKKATPIHSKTRLKRRRQSGAFGVIFFIALISLCAALAIWQPWKKDPAEPDTTSELPLNTGGPKKSFNPNGGERLSLQKRWSEARRLVGSGDYPKSIDAFLSISQDPTVTGLEHIWATLEASVIQSLSGEPGKARGLAAKSLEELDALPQQRSIHRRYREIADPLKRIPAPTAGEIPEEPKDIIDWMGTFALALKLWEQGQWEQALPFLATVRNASLPQEYSWFEVYQNIADLYLADAQILTSLKDLDAPKNAGEASQQIAQIASASSKLRTLGRAKYNLQARQAHLARVRKGFRSSPVFQESKGWKETSILLSQHAKAYRFGEVAALLVDLPKDAPPEAVWAWKYLQRNASAFIKDLSKLRDWSAETKDGKEITPLSGNSKGLKLADGSVVPWANLKPGRLISEHVDDEAHAIAFAWLVGLTEKAESMAEDLAGYDDDFKRDWRRVLIGSSQ